jgi:hypothetical protein
MELARTNWEPSIYIFRYTASLWLTGVAPEMSSRVILIAESIRGINQKALCTFSEIKGSNIGRGVSAA